MQTTKLLTILLIILVFSTIETKGQCSLITVNGSTQDPSSVCAPVNFTLEAKYEFMLPVDTSLVRILFRWNDGTGATTYLPGNWNISGDSIWASASHTYFPTDECSRTAEAILEYDGELCTSSGYQAQIFSTWGTDEENSGVLSTDPVVHYVCEGEDIVDVTFDDNSTFNCNINIEPDRPNRYFRWVQFVYNTDNQPGERIPSVTVRDAGSIIYPMTDAAGLFIDTLAGPVIRIPIPADGPNQTSFPISAPAGGVAGDIFEITMRNWNVCNPYDNNPLDGLLPSDPVNGDNPPITTTARIEIIAPPPVVVATPFEFCTGDNILLTANAGTGFIRWYKDATLDTLLRTGNNFNPTLPPTSIDPDVAGNYSFYVTSFQGICESAPSRVDLIIYQTPQNANAGPDILICSDSATLTGNIPSVGSGIWTTSGSAIIANPTNYTTKVSNLNFGTNTFRWTISNGTCVTSDIVRVVSDRQPAAANAGVDRQLCDMNLINLTATPPNLSGAGYWNIISGAGVISDSANPTALYSGIGHSANLLTWRVSSRYGACPITTDSVLITADYSAGPANAGFDASLCESSSYILNANPPVNNGTGFWYFSSGAGIIADSLNSTTTVNNLSYGNNQIIWQVESKLGICPDDSDTINIIRYQFPGVANAGPDKSYCLETQDTLDGNSPVIGTGSWNVISNPSAVPPAFSPNNADPKALFTVMPGNEGIYTLMWQLANGPCFSRDTVVLDFGIPVPPANAGPDTISCGYSYQMAGNPIINGLGTWSLLSGPGSVSYTSNSHQNNVVIDFIPGKEGIYFFEWRLASGSCPTSADTVEVSIKKAPLAPILADKQSCGPDSFDIHIPTADPDHIAYWYPSAISTTKLYMGLDYSTGLLNSSAQYFISLYDTLTACESGRSQLDIIIDQVPQKPLLLPDTLCGAGSAFLQGIVMPPANSIIWYADKLGNVVLDTSMSLLFTSVTATKTLFARSINTSTGCMSEIDSVQIKVWPSVPAPVTFSDTSCGTNNFILYADKSTPSNSLFWYDASNALITIGDSLQTTTIDSTTSFFVAEYNPATKCFSNLSEIKAVINPLPPVPSISDIENCGAGSFILQPLPDASITEFRYYSNPITNSLIAIGDSFITPVISAKTSYWISGYNSNTGCEGPREEVEIKIYPNPGLISILGPTLVLKDQSNVVFFEINGRAGSTYSWSIPAGINLEANMNDFVRLGFPTTGTYTISVFETTINGCIGQPDYHSITVINDSIAVDIGDYNQSACTADKFEIKPWLFGGTPPYTYSWTGDISYLSSTNTLFTTFNPPGVGNYYLYLEIIDVNLKVVRDSIHITVFESPVTDIINTNTTACVDDNFQLYTNSSGYGLFSSLWSGPIHNLSNYTLAEPVYTPHQEGIAKLLYAITDINGCKATDSITLVSEGPVAGFNILTPPGCSPLPVEFENTSTGATTYNWQFSDGSGTNAVNPLHTFVNQTVEIKYHEVILTARSPLGCTDKSTGYVMVWPNPTADITALPQNSCNPANIMLVSTPGNSLYRWQFGDGSSDTISSKFNIYHTFINSTFTDKTFPVHVITQSSLNCFDTASIDVTVYATPVAEFTVTPEEQEFPESSFEIENLTLGNWQFAWDFGDGKSSTLKSPGTINYDQSGVYTISLRVSGTHCSDSASSIIRLLPAPPVASFKGADDGCMPHTITLVNQSTYAESYLWEFGDGSVSTAKDPSYTYYEPGIYKIKLTVTGEGGKASFSDTTRVFILPNSFFDLAPRYVYVNDEAVHYFNLSDNGEVFEWDFGDNTKSAELNPTHVYKDAGTYNVTLKVWTVNGCFDLYIMENAVFAEPSGKVEFPNAFRPGSPLEENNVFMPGIIDHVDDYHLMIFNRWGELIFESFDQEIGWDGIYKGEVAKQDVYIWKVKGTYTDGKGFTKTGNVTLLY